MNPYEVLNVAPGADNAAIVRAMAQALQARRHDAATLAEAQRALLTPERRLLADFCLPVFVGEGS